MADQFREGVDLRWLKRFGFGNQVLIARSKRHSDQVDADGRSSCAVVGGGELVNDCGYAVGDVLRGLRVLNSFAWYKNFYSYGHADTP